MNKPMFWIGIIVIVVAAILLLGDFLSDSSFPIIFGIIGIVFIGASKYRPLKQKKK
jgi:hypothetical protein